MPLLKYKEKRNLKESPEPRGGKSDSEKLRFVIQKHDASHLHYDFRLEMEGVLKSWAIPKGPSTDPEIKRLAVMVEDHPFDYRNFEGVIPSGYGAGTVIVWDEGYYEPAWTEAKDKKSMEKELRKGINSGKLHIKIVGKKLKGEYALVKTHVRGQNSWLFFKVKDKYVSKEDITLKDKSVISKKTLEQIAKTYDNPVDTKVLSGKGGSKNKRVAKTYDNPVDTKVLSGKEALKNKSVKKSISDEIISKGKRSKFPEKISPMLATLVDKPFDKEGWTNEVKWDGYRTIAFCNKKK